MNSPKQIAEWESHHETTMRLLGEVSTEDRIFALQRLAWEAIPALLAEREEMLALLREVEWADNSGDEYTAECPSCGGVSPGSASAHGYPADDPDIGHRATCRLAAFLQGAP